MISKFFLSLSAVTFLCLGGAVFAQNQGSKEAPIKVTKEEKIGSWKYLCANIKKSDGTKNRCLISYTAMKKIKGKDVPIASIEIFKVKNENIVNILSPLRVFLPTGVGIEIDGKKDKISTVPFIYCTHIGCKAEGKMPAELVNSLKKGSKAKVYINSIDQGTKEVSVPLNGISKALARL